MNAGIWALYFQIMFFHNSQVVILNLRFLQGLPYKLIQYCLQYSCNTLNYLELVRDTEVF